MAGKVEGKDGNAEQARKKGKVFLARAIAAREYLSTLPKALFFPPMRALIVLLEKYLKQTLLIELPVLPSPLENTFGVIGKLDDLSKLQSLGVIRKIHFLEQAPDEPYLYLATVENDSDDLASAGDFFDPEKALTRAVGEAVERHAWDLGDALPSFERGSVRDMQGKNILDLSTLAGFSRGEREKHPALSYDEETKFGWVKGASLTERAEVWVPAQLVSRDYVGRNQQNISAQRDGREPILRWSVSTGLAAGRTRDAALLAGLLEVIERDAFMIAYANRLSPPLIDLDFLAEKSERLCDILARFKRYRLKPFLVELPTDFPVQVFLCVLIDETGVGPRVSVGAAAGFDLEELAIKALSEALMVFKTARKELAREEKRKLDNARLDRDGRIMYWARKKDAQDIAFFLKGPQKKIDLRESADMSDSSLCAALIGACKEKGYRALSVDLADRKLARTGWHVTFTLIPELQPLHLLEHVPYLSGERLRSVPEALGYAPAPELNREPHPFS